MRRIILIITCTISLAAKGQFQGKIIYRVEYEATDPDKENMLSMLPERSVLTVKDDRSLFEQAVAGGGRQAFIIDASKGSGILVMQFLGQEYKVEMSKEEIETLKQTQKLKIVPTHEKKIVAGEPCLGAMALSESDTLRVYYTENITSPASFPPFANIEGLPLEYELIRGGVKMRYTAVEVIRTAIDPVVFTTDPNIESIKFEDFARSFAISR